MSRLDNRAYYDDFAGWYERERHLPYHRMLDDLEVEIVERYGKDRDVLEVGCGTGLILGRVGEFARTATGIDLSGGMLAKAAARGLAVAQASATDLPIATASVDVAYSFKVLAHIPDIAGTMREMARVVRPGGHVIAEFYNARSLRRLVKAIKPPTKVSETTHDEHVYTRYDDRKAIESYLPDELEWVATRGIRIVTPVAAVLRVPVVGAAVRWAEHRLAVALGQAALDVLQLLADQSAGEIDVDVVLEVDGDIRQAEQGNRSHFLDRWEAGHAALDGGGEQLLDVFGRKAWRLGVDADLDRGHVRKRIHRHLAERVNAQADHHGEGDEHQDLVTQRGVNDCIEHGDSYLNARRRFATSARAP